MNRYLTLGLMIALGLAGCGESDDNPGVYQPGSPGSGGRGGSGSGGKGGSAGKGGSGGSGGEMQPEGAPVVTITSPEAAEAPNEDSIITSDEVLVVCTVTQSTDSGSKPVDPASVKVAVLDGEDMVIDEAAAGPTGETDEYSGTVLVSSASNGPVFFRCSAEDTSSTAIVGSATVQGFVDHGPVIEASSPKADVAYPIIGALSFDFTVDDAPLDEDDDGATVEEVTLQVAGIPIDLEDEGAADYSLDIDLSDPVLFEDALTGSVPVSISATNARGVTRTLEYSFIADGTGPIIDVTSHDSADVIGGEVKLVFKVSDALSGVDPDSVVVKINEEENRYDSGSTNWTRNGDSYSFRFDSRTTEGSDVQLTINILATDTVGNDSEGEALTLWLDNHPPIVDLDPGNVRERVKEGQKVYCSESFDPLGEAIGDLADVDQLEIFRALVWEESNDVGQNFIHLAGTDPSSVKLYVQKGSGTGMLKDTNGDDICDDVDPMLDLKFVKLDEVKPTGTSWLNDETAAAPFPQSCDAKGADTPPAPLCTDNSSDLRRVIQHEIADKVETVIYARGVQSGTIECTGSDWEFSSFVDEGWACLAAVATDFVDNRGVSAPIRVCYDDPNTPEEPACKADKSNPPSCRQNDCTTPKRFAAQVIDR